MGVECLSYLKSIETHARAVLTLIILSIGTVWNISMPLTFWHGNVTTFGNFGTGKFWHCGHSVNKKIGKLIGECRLSFDYNNKSESLIINFLFSLSSFVRVSYRK